ncbi:hypothetical protein ACOME3_001246 [Neoechinorhynchus agilis]
MATDSDASNGPQVKKSDMKTTSIKLTADQEKLYRIIGVHLLDTGLKRTLEALSKETGIVIEEPRTSDLRECILNGDWNTVRQLVKTELYEELKSNVAPPRPLLCIKKILRRVLRQEILEMCGSDVDPEAVERIRTEMADTSEYQYLDQSHTCDMYYVLIEKNEALTKDEIASGRRAVVNYLERILPESSSMLPAGRLNDIVRRAALYNEIRCPFHPSNVDLDYIPPAGEAASMSHVCPKEKHPYRQYQVINAYGCEIWCCSFSPDGTLLATGTSDGKVGIWTFESSENNKMGLVPKYSFDLDVPDVEKQVGTIAWRRDSRGFAVAGTEKSTKVFIWNMDRCEWHMAMTPGHQDDIFHSVGWYPDNLHFAAGGMKGKLVKVNSDTGQVKAFIGIRCNQLFVTLSGIVLFVDGGRRLRSLDLDANRLESIVAERRLIVSFTLDKAETKLVVASRPDCLNLYSYPTMNLLNRFVNSFHSLFIHQPQFGGISDHFVACGAEDGIIRIWNTNHVTPILYLQPPIPGPDLTQSERRNPQLPPDQSASSDPFANSNSGTHIPHPRLYCTNAIAWNSSFPTILISAQDDGTLIVWTNGSGSQEDAKRIANSVHENIAQTGHVAHTRSQFTTYDFNVIAIRAKISS